MLTAEYLENQETHEQNRSHRLPIHRDWSCVYRNRSNWTPRILSYRRCVFGFGVYYAAKSVLKLISRTQLGSATNGPCDTRLFVFGFKSFKIY